jgi:hypothetical protein
MIAITKILSTLKITIKYPVMNFIDAARGLSRQVRNIVVSIYPIDNTREEKRNGDPDYGPLSCFFCANNVGVLLKHPNLMQVL